MSEEDSWVSSDNADDDDEDEEEIEENDNDELYYPICCKPETCGLLSFPSLADALQHDVETHGFQLLDYLPKATHQDFLEESIVLVNKCRSFVIDDKKTSAQDTIGSELSAFLEAEQNTTDEQYDNERFFRPVMADDAILMSMDDLQILKQQHDEKKQLLENAQVVAPTTEIHSDGETVQALKLQVEAMREQLERAKACIKSLTLLEESSSEDSSKKPSSRKTKLDVDTYYFSSYSHHSIHQTMLQDDVRTKAYQDAILKNPQLFQDKVVLDIGCGTGVLSVFAARAGARKVVAIDGSDILKEARDIVALNGYEQVIYCVRGKVEDLIANQKLPLDENEQVDVIVSEWMGYALLFETMLPSVMVARDALMTRTGTMFPNGSTIFLEGASDLAMNYWNNVYDIDMTPMKTRVARELTEEASVEIVPPEAIVTNRCKLITFDLNTCRDEDLDFCAEFELKPKNDGNKAVIAIDKLVVSFDIAFDSQLHLVTFSTGCQSRATHWKQTTLWFDPLADGVPTLQSDQVMRGTFRMRRNKENHREMDFKILWEVGTIYENGSFDRQRDGKLTTKLSA